MLPSSVFNFDTRMGFGFWHSSYSLPTVGKFLLLLARYCQLHLSADLNLSLSWSFKLGWHFSSSEADRSHCQSLKAKPVLSSHHGGCKCIQFLLRFLDLQFFPKLLSGEGSTFLRTQCSVGMVTSVIRYCRELWLHLGNIHRV
ncbi:hypothetical protein Ancab_007433 [Ancistrocladus abbreviatus]